MRNTIFLALVFWVASISTGCGHGVSEKPKDMPKTKEVEMASVEAEQTAEGATVTVGRRTTLAYLEVIERSPAAKSVTRITDNEDPGTILGPPIPSPKSDELVYTIFKKGYSNIWRQKATARARTKLTETRAQNVTPAFSSDGEFVVFSSNVSGVQFRLLRIKLSGGGGKQYLTRTEAADLLPSCSSDGHTIAYESLPPYARERQIWSIDTNTGLTTQLREGEQPCVSPDANRILFVRKAPKSTAQKDKQPDGTPKMEHAVTIWVMNVDGGGETQLTQNTKYHTGSPSWSPDGKWIVYHSNEGLNSLKRQNYDLWRMRADGSQKTQLTTNGSEDTNPRFSHDGKSIYFLSNRGGITNIWRLSPR